MYIMCICLYVNVCRNTVLRFWTHQLAYSEQVFDGARFTIICNGDIVTPKLQVGTGKTRYTRTRDGHTRTRPDP